MKDEKEQVSGNNTNNRKRGPRNNESRGSGRRRSNRGNSSRKFYSECPICGKGVRDILTAIAWGEERKASHFDCILKQLGENEDMQPKEKVVYLGAGSFGIVQFRSGSGNNQRFTVRKRIQLEEKEEKIEWRRKVSRDIR